MSRLLDFLESTSSNLELLVTYSNHFFPATGPVGFGEGPSSLYFYTDFYTHPRTHACTHLYAHVIARVCAHVFAQGKEQIGMVRTKEMEAELATLRTKVARTHTRTHARTDAHTHARTHGRTHALRWQRRGRACHIAARPSISARMPVMPGRASMQACTQQVVELEHVQRSMAY